MQYTKQCFFYFKNIGSCKLEWLIELGLHLAEAMRFFSRFLFAFPISKYGRLPFHLKSCCNSERGNVMDVCTVWREDQISFAERAKKISKKSEKSRQKRSLRLFYSISLSLSLTWLKTLKDQQRWKSWRERVHMSKVRAGAGEAREETISRPPSLPPSLPSYLKV